MAIKASAPGPVDHEIQIAGAKLILRPDGGLWWPEQAVLVVSDLHLEKGSSYAARGQMLPPYDTGITLAKVAAMIDELSPVTCISLGDSFHDGEAEARLPAADRARIKALTSRTDWIWVEGNHDPDPPQSLGGRAANVLRVGPLVFRHEPTGERGEIAGHLHPVARVQARGRSVRKKCFACDGDALIMPALGALTGGLNVLDQAFTALFPNGVKAYAMGTDRIYGLEPARLKPDGFRRRA